MKNFVNLANNSPRYDFVFIGSGFGSLFFLKKCLQNIPENARVIILERGTYATHSEQVLKGGNSFSPKNPELRVKSKEFYNSPPGHKSWNFTVGLGGGTLCWWGQVMRLHPSDFMMKTLYGRGEDWPITYEQLEQYYCEAEEIIGVAGDSDRVGPFWRSRPFPLPAFRGSSVDEKIRENNPNQLSLAAARDSLGQRRPQCCAFGECQLCPHDSKFTALNGLSDILTDNRVEIALNANVLALEIEAGIVNSVVVESDGRRFEIYGEHFVLGANAIFNPVILSRSGLGHPELGRGINEQVGANIEIQLASLSGLNGGTSATGVNIELLDGPHRKEFGASMFIFDNRWKFKGLRTEHGKHLNTLNVIINTEDLRSQEHHIEVPEDWGAAPIVHHSHHGQYGEQGMEYALLQLPKLFEGLDVEHISEPTRRVTESHLQCSVPAGNDFLGSIVDANMLHHQVRNLNVVGTSAFPTCPVANPSLTAAAWSLRSASQLFG